MTNFYSIFHCNLSFSLIEESEYLTVINQCYWPLIMILESNKNLKIGIEISGNSLKKIKKLDPSLINKFKELIKLKKIDIIASGLEQVLGPLVPSGVTLDNLALGLETYNEILKIKPKMAYINEQTFSDGIIGLYKIAGFESLILDWDNLPLLEKNKQSFYTNKSIPYQPIKIKSQDGIIIDAIFISSVAMLQFRRVIFGAITRNQYFRFLKNTTKESKISNFPIYGDDLEIYDFKPGSVNLGFKNQGKDFKKIQDILEFLLKKGYKFILPSDLKIQDTQQIISITDAQMPIRTKKQEKYNITRWAVCGRNNSKTNTSCYKIYKKIKILESLTGKRQKGIREDLVSLWASDYRTHTTESKNQNFLTKSGYLLEDLNLKIKDSTHVNDLKHHEFILINYLDEDWDMEVFEAKISFPQGLAFGNIEVQIEGKTIINQQEDEEFYQDRSIASTKIIFKPFVKANKRIKGKFIFRKKEETKLIKVRNLTTDSSIVKFWLKKGGVFESITFPRIYKKPLFGSLFHGYYQNPKLSADWFSGHTIISQKDSSNLTDLENIEFYSPENIDYFPIRIPIYGKINMGDGEVVKKIYIYVSESRVDIEKKFMFYNLDPKTFRILNLTLIPGSFDINSLYLSTINGGLNTEKYLLKRSYINHDEAVNLKVSTHGCLGKTTGWVAVGDKDKGIAVISDMSNTYSVPLIHFEETEENFFARISISVAESDETSFHFYRGKLNFKNTLFGYKNIKEVEKKSNFINNSLLFIQGESQ